MAQTMGNAFGLASLYDPQIAVDQDEIARRQMLADVLRKKALDPLGANRQIGGVAYAISPLEGLSQMFSAYVASKMDQDTGQKKIDMSERQAKALGAMADMLTGSPAQKVTAPQDVRPAGVSREAMQAGGFPQPADASPQAVATQNAFADQQNDIRQKARAALLMGNQDLANKLIGNLYELTPEQKNMAYKGIDPQAMGRAEYAKAVKEGRMEAQPGNTILDPVTMRPLYTAPDFKSGVQGSFDAQGRPSLSLIPGQDLLTQQAAEQAGAKATAEQSARAHFFPQMVTNAAGAQVPYQPQGAPPFAQPGQQLPPQGQPQIPQAVLDANRSGQPFVATQAPGQPPQFQQGGPSKDPFANIPRMPQPQGIGQTTYDAERAKYMAKFANDKAVEVSTNAASALDRINNATRIQELLKAVPNTGSAAEIRTNIEKAMVTAGLVDGKNVANSEMLMSLLAQNTLKAIHSSGLGGGNGFSNQDREFLDLAVGGKVSINPDTLRRMSELSTRSAQYDLQKAQNFGRYMEQGGDPMRFEAWNAQYFAPSAGSVAAGGRPPLSSFNR